MWVWSWKREIGLGFDSALPPYRIDVDGEVAEFSIGRGARGRDSTSRRPRRSGAWRRTTMTTHRALQPRHPVRRARPPRLAADPLRRGLGRAPEELGRRAARGARLQDRGLRGRGGPRRRAGRPRSQRKSEKVQPERDAPPLHELRRQREAVRLRRARLELRRLEEDTFDRVELTACTFKLWRSVRDRLDAAVGRESPLLAARLGVEEGRMYRELRAFVRGVEQDISDRGAVKLLAEAGKAGDEDEVRPW